MSKKIVKKIGGYLVVLVLCISLFWVGFNSGFSCGQVASGASARLLDIPDDTIINIFRISCELKYITFVQYYFDYIPSYKLKNENHDIDISSNKNNLI